MQLSHLPLPKAAIPQPSNFAVGYVVRIHLYGSDDTHPPACVAFQSAAEF
jgi:hypothetical protein